MEMGREKAEPFALTNGVNINMIGKENSMTTWNKTLLTAADRRHSWSDAEKTYKDCSLEIVP